MPGAERAEADLDRELAAVAAEAVELEADAHVGRQPLGDEHAGALPHELVCLVTEELGRSRRFASEIVPLASTTQDRVGPRLEERAKERVARLRVKSSLLLESVRG